MEGLPEDLKSPGKGPCLKGEASPVELIVIVVTRLSYGCPSKPLFTLMTEIAEPSLATKSKSETIAKKCMKNE